MRAFLGFPCGEELSDRLVELQSTMPSSSVIKRVDPENFHLTIKFLGDCSRSQLDDLDHRFLRQLPTPGPFSLSVRGVGTFPDPSNPSVLWAGVEQPERLEQFVDSVESISVECGAEPENRDYHAHVTLGRVKGDALSTDELVAWIQQYGEQSFGTIEADQLILYESVLNDDGPQYHVLERWPL